MTPGGTAAFHTLGCKLNFSETSTIARDLADAGYARVGIDDAPDVVVINTCSVTDQADAKCRNAVRRARNGNPHAFVAVVGCYAQLKPQEISQIEGVNLVLGAQEKFNLAKHLIKMQPDDPAAIEVNPIKEVKAFVPGFSSNDRTRAFLKVQDGCDYKCTYCTIPLARGISRSDKLENVLNNARSISERGIQEIVLTGVNIGDYGKGEFGNKKHQHTFLDLVKSLDKVEGINRLRISSIEPNLLKNETIEFVAKSKAFVPHFHIPLQSGSDDILKKMKRRYLSDLYVDRVNTIKTLMPHCCIGVDVIVGFPGETEEHFLETYTFLNELDISYLHVFSYCERANTEAAEMDNPIDKNLRHKRSKMLRVLSAKKKRQFYEQQKGSQRMVLFESENKDGFMYGFTENYVRVKTPFNEQWINQLKPTTLNTIDEDGIYIFESD